MSEIQLMTNDELKEEAKRLTIEFEQKKQIILTIYREMMTLKDKWEKIDNLLSRREGKQ